jgi:S1-C subfamily serine protease
VPPDRQPTFRSNALVRAVAAIVALIAAGLIAFEVAIHVAHLDAATLRPFSAPAGASPTPAPVPLADIGRAALSRVVTIEAVLPNEESLGTGWLYDTHGDFVTNAHVVSGQLNIRITDRLAHVYVATVIGMDAAADIAVVRVTNAFPGTPLPVGMTALTTVPVDVITLASSRATGKVDLTANRIIMLHEDVPLSSGQATPTPGAPTVYHDMLHLTGAQVYEGNSGGPVIDARGNVIGIVTLADPTHPDSYAIPISRVLEELRGFAARSG